MVNITEEKGLVKVNDSIFARLRRFFVQKFSKKSNIIEYPEENILASGIEVENKIVQQNLDNNVEKDNVNFIDEKIKVIMITSSIRNEGKSFIAFPSTAAGGTLSRIRPTLTEGAVVTTGKNDVDMIVTEYGLAKLRGRTLSQRVKALISIAHPDFRDELTFTAKKSGIL